MILMVSEFKDMFDSYGFEISDIQYSYYERYAGLLIEWNKKVNLTAITDSRGISEKHFLDSIIPLNYVEIKSGAKLADIGSGAGFPAFPLKIYRNDLNVTLLDSLNKRAIFLRKVSEELMLPAECVHARAEDGGKDIKYREKFDIVTARAVAPLNILCEYCLPFAGMGGIFLALKGPNEDYKTALNAIKILGGEITDIFEYSLPGGDNRKLYIINKIKPTPDKYPRSSAQIKRDLL